MQIAYFCMRSVCTEKKRAPSLIPTAKHNIRHHFLSNVCVFAVITAHYDNNPDALRFLSSLSRSRLSFPGLPAGGDRVARVSSLGHSVLLHAAHAGDRQPGKGLRDDPLHGLT